jgi:hypothetical protein
VSDLPNIVLVHGAWADGSCWSTVIESLQSRGYTVTAPQFPETSLADDVARLRHVLGWQAGPTVVVGHSYAPPGTSSRPTTRRSRPMPSASSRHGWERRRSRLTRAISRWSPTPMTW